MKKSIILIISIIIVVVATVIGIKAMQPSNTYAASIYAMLPAGQYSLSLEKIGRIDEPTKVKVSIPKGIIVNGYGLPESCLNGSGCTLDTTIGREGENTRFQHIAKFITLTQISSEKQTVNVVFKEGTKQVFQKELSVPSTVSNDASK